MNNKLVFLPIILLLNLLTACISSADIQTIPIIDTGIDEQSWVTISPGEFLRGQHEIETSLDYSYQMMVTDVTNAQYAQFINQALRSGDIRVEGIDLVGYYPGDPFGGHKHEELIDEGFYPLLSLNDPGVHITKVNDEYVPVSGYENHPVVMVTWFGARAFCEYYEGRLPSEVEWEKAARGSDGRPFPWGDNIQTDNANFYSSHDIFEKTFGGAGSTTPVGFYNGQHYQGFQTQDSPSPYGLYDMAGNVWQWTGDVYPDQHYRYMRGGSKENYAYNLRVWTRNSAAPDYFSPNVGFRCARDTQ